MERENLINDDIRAPSVIVVREGNSVTRMEREEALREAQEMGVDLVQVSKEEVGKEPACRLVDYGKFMYQKKKKRKNGVQKTSTKEIRFRPVTQENDYQVKLRKIKEFLGKKNRVKVSVSFRGRESDHKELGIDLMNRILEDTGFNKTPSLENNSVTVVLE